MQSQEDKVPHLLDKLQITKFQLKDYRNLDDCEYRAPGFSSRNTGKTFEIVYNHNFNQDLLITHLEVEFNHQESFSQFFQVGEIQAGKLTNRGIMSSVIRSSSLKTSHQSKNFIIPCITITQSLKLSFLLKKDFTVSYNDVLCLRKERGRHASEQNVLKMIHHTFKNINICGYHLTMNTAASELVNLLNISQSFKHLNRFDEAAETDILVSLSLISARRFVQAAQALKSASKFYVEKYISSKSSMDFSRIDKSWIKEDHKDQMDISGFSRSFATGRVLEGGRYLYKAAKIELLLADTINQPNLLGQKLDAFNRANSYASGNTNPEKIKVRADYEEVSYNIGPSIVPFLVKVLTDKSQIFRISALKSIEFFYQTLGCTLSNYMPLILKTLISIYPSQKERQESALKTQQNSVERTQTSSRTKLILDHTNHLLQSLLSLLPGMNKKCLKLMFEEIISVSMTQEYRNQLRLYLLRFGQRILQICASDLEINVNYIRYVFAISQGKYSKKTDNNKHISHNLVYFAQRIIQILRSKILKHYNKTKCLTEITSWINDTLIGLCENQNVTSNTHLNHILDLVISIYSQPKISLQNPIQPVIYLLNTSLNEPKLPFQKVLEAFIVLVRYGNRFQGGCDLAIQIIERVLGRSKMCTLTSKQLNILERVLETVPEAKTFWLQEFLECIPHSNFDQIYSVFDLLVLKSLKLLNKDIISLIIRTLLDQYTVKGKAHQQSKELFITNIIKQIPESLQILLQLCLFENQEPKIQNYQSKKQNIKEHGIDSKQYKLNSELFGQKINLLLFVFNKSELIHEQFKNVFNNQNIFLFYQALKNIIEVSQNFKIKSKLLILIKQFILLSGNITALNNQILTSKIFQAKVLLDILKSFVNMYKDSKLQYYSLLNIGLIFQQLQITCQSASKSKESTSLEFLEQELSPNFKIKFPLQSNFESIIAYEILKMWGSLLPLLNSPLQNVRQIFMFVFLYTFKNGILNIKSSVKDKLIELIKPLLINYLQSTDYSERLFGIRLFSLFIGFGRQFSDSKNYSIEIGKSLRPFRLFLETIICLEDDWNEDVSYCSRLISKVCISKELKIGLNKKMKCGRKNSNFLDNSSLSFNLQEEMAFQKKQTSFDILNNFDAILKSEDQFHPDQQFEMPQFKAQFKKEIEEFKNQIDKIHFNHLDNMPERDSFIEEEQHYFDPNDEKHSEKENQTSRSEEEPLSFETLGIIELDDEEWGQEENQVNKITQKLPLKKVYKLSPNLGSSTKHHRLRNKRMHPQFEQHKIIIDEVQQRNYSPPAPPPQPQHQKSRYKPEPLKRDFQDSTEMKIQYKPKQEEVKRAIQEFEETEKINSLSDDMIISEVRQLKKQKQKKHPKKRKSSTLK